MKNMLSKINFFLFYEKKKHAVLFRIFLGSLVLLFILVFFIPNVPNIFGATYTWVQTSWTGGITANNAVHPTNQSSWTEYSASTTGMATANGGADLQLLQVSSSTIQTSDSDFNSGSNSNTQVLNGSVKLTY